MEEANYQNETMELSRRIMDAVIDYMIHSETQTKLPSERELSQSLAVSRASVREVISALSLIGLIERKHGGGNYISDLQIAPFIQSLSRLIEQKAKPKDLWAVRSMLEREAIYLITSQPITPMLEAEMADIIGLMKTAWETQDAAYGNQLDLQFHQLLFRHCGNEVLRFLAECIEEILRNLVVYNRTIILSHEENGLVLYEQHRALAAAISQRDTNRAITLLNEHLEFVKNYETKKEEAQ